MSVFRHPSCALIDDDRIVRQTAVTIVSAATMKEDSEILQEIGRFVEAKLTGSYGFSTIPIPDEEAVSSTSILASPDWMTASKLLLIIQNSSGSMIGIFSRTLCLEQGLNKGSMLPYIDRALAEGYGVIILRPNSNSVLVNEGKDGNPIKMLIPGSESPEVHALCVWENIVVKNENASHIMLLGYGNGASLCKELLLRQVVRTRENELEPNRIRAMITIEASEIVDEDDGADIRDLIASISINMECSESPRGSRLSYRKSKLGCVSVSLGLPGGVSEVTNVAESLPLALDPAFRFLELSLSVAPVTKFCELFALQNGLGLAGMEILMSPSKKERDDLLLTSASPLTPKSAPPAVGLLPQQKETLFTWIFGRRTSYAGAESDGLTVKDFELINLIGKGAFGKVMMVKKKRGVNGGKIYAMKILKKKDIEEKGQVENTKAEREILLEIRHPFIVRLRYAFQNETKLYLVTDYYNGGSLFYHLKKTRTFQEDRARFYGAELLLALDHLHTQNIIYRDLKLENILLDHLGHIALTDFGLSKTDTDKTGGATTFCGTAEYIAPELLKLDKRFKNATERYGKAVDWWSFGILLYEMLTGKTPFYDKNRKTMFIRILKMEPTFPVTISSAACNCIKGLLKTDENERLGSSAAGAKDIMATEFFALYDFDAIYRREVVPPYKPDVRNEVDTKYIPNVYLDEKAADSFVVAVPSRGGADNFQEFSFNGASST